MRDRALPPAASGPAHRAAPGRVRRLIGALSAAAWLALAALPAQAAPPQAAAVVAAPADDGVPAASWRHGHAAFGAPKYPLGFTHFEYVNPDAPKRGTLYLRNPDRRSSWDKYNPFTTKGNAPAGPSIFMFESLAITSGDEPATMYGLLAEAMLVAPDKSSITFRLHPKARFYNGDPVTAEDVLHSFRMVSGKQASPAAQAAYAVIERAELIDGRTIRFDLKERTNDALFTAGGVPVFSRKWTAGPDGQQRRFDEVISEYPITSGPYTIEKSEPGRRLELKRNPDYWARDLGVRRGFFNFDRVVYRYYKDQAVGREAFKAGEFDLYKEYGGRSWVRQHKGPKWDDGRILKDLFETGVGQGMQSYHLNNRLPKFADRRVRRALDYTYDFDTLNRAGLFKRVQSVFSNSDFAAEGLPSPAELALLEPFRKDLWPEVFGPAYRAPRTHGNPKELRANLLKARELFAEAGWKLAPDGKLRNAAGDAFTIEYMAPSEGSRLPDWELNLKKLGIELKVRPVDFALYSRRLQEYDFEMVTIVEGDFTLPDATALANLYGSKAADEKGNGNYRGIKNPALDFLIDKMANARSMDELRTAARAFDRVVTWGHYQVPDLYAADEKASYWNRFGLPATRPRYFTLESALSSFPAWAVTTWWLKDDPVR